MAHARSGLIPPGGQGPNAEAIVAALPSAIVVVDAHGRVDYVNAAGEVLLNASAAQLRHKPFGMVMRLPEACLAGLREKTAFAAYDCQIERADGQRLHVDFHATPVADFSGWCVVTLHSGAAAHAMGQRLDRRDRSRSAIGAAAMLAHEIKNPLSGIRGAAQLLDAHVGNDGRAMTRLIRDEVDRVASLIDRMEAFTDARPLERQAQNLYPILEHARAVAATGFGDRIDFGDAYDPSLPPVLVNRDALIQILLNLFKNAAEAVPDGQRGRVILTTRYRYGVSVAAETGRQSLPIEIGVADDGPGPPPEITEHLFEPFVSSKISGRGLGLALVDKLVRDNGGIIQFTRENAQSVFRILLPRA